MGVPKEAVHIVIYKAPKNNWATGGKSHSEKHSQIPFTITLGCLAQIVGNI